MEFKPVREKDGGPVINWLADRLMSIASLLMKIALPYATMYEATFDEDDEQTDPGNYCAEGCCSVDHSL